MLFKVVMKRRLAAAKLASVLFSAGSSGSVSIAKPQISIV